MKNRVISKITAILLGMFLVTSTVAQAALVLGFDFQTGTPINASGSVSQTYDANFGTGTLYMNGTNGSSSWDPQSSSVYNQLNSTNGTAVNTGGTPFSTLTPNPSAITFRQPQVTNGGTNTNGFSAVFKFSMSGYEDLSISYAFNRQNTNSYSNLQWDFSTDGTTWYSIGAQTVSAVAWEAYSLPLFSGLDNASVAYVRVTFSGSPASATGKGFYMDNFQFNATAVPEPTTALLFFTAAGALLFARRARR